MNRKAIAIAPSQLFRAFADPTRLRLLHLLRGGELCVGDMMTALRLPQAKTSRHLRYLLRAGLVRVREQGLWSFYALAHARNRVHQRLLGCVGSCFTDVPEMARDARRSAAIRKKGGCCPA